MLDPLAGPRDPSWFLNLERIGRRNYRVTPTTSLREPAGSSLPRLASELPARLYLLDPREGAVGLRSQLQELADLLDVDSVQIVDVGGDILAIGDEAGLRSPLADSLVLAAAQNFGPNVGVLITGCGLDGELPESLVLARCRLLTSNGSTYRLSPEATLSYAPLFRWHPSEATGLLWAAAMGARGTAEVRDGGYPVILSDHSIEIHRLDHGKVLDLNLLAQGLITTRSLDEAEDAIRRMGAVSEIDYERKCYGHLLVKTRRCATAALLADGVRLD